MTLWSRKGDSEVKRRGWGCGAGSKNGGSEYCGPLETGVFNIAEPRKQGVKTLLGTSLSVMNIAYFATLCRKHYIL